MIQTFSDKNFYLAVSGGALLPYTPSDDVVNFRAYFDVS